MNCRKSLPQIIGLIFALLLLVVPSTASSVDLLLGQVKGVFVNKDTGKLVRAKPNLLRPNLKNETEAELSEIQKYMDKIELKTNKQGEFHFIGVPPGQYVVFTTRNGVVTPAFTVSPSQVVDLGKIKVGR